MHRWNIGTTLCSVYSQFAHCHLEFERGEGGGGDVFSPSHPLISIHTQPSWTMYIQVMTFEQAEKWNFNPFDLTKVLLCDLVPMYFNSSWWYLTLMQANS